eukprot:jgi/Mesvir1/16401/Mv18139-RA.1
MKLQGGGVALSDVGKGELELGRHSAAYQSLETGRGNTWELFLHKWQSALAAGAYGFTSVSITLFNKAVFAVFHFPYPALFTCTQILISIAFMLLLRAVGAIQFANLERHMAWKLMPLSTCWWLYVVSGLTGLRYLNVPMFSILRRATTIVVMVGEILFFKKYPSWQAVGAISVMVTGAVMASVSDVTFSLPGYLAMAICWFSTAAYLMLIKHLKSLGLSDFTMLFYNNMLSLPLMVAYILLGTNELRDVVHYPKLRDPGFLAFMAVSASQALLLNVCVYRCTGMNSALVTSCMGQVKNLVVTLLGFYLFQDIVHNALNDVGLAIGLIGSALFALQGYLELRKKYDSGN